MNINSKFKLKNLFSNLLLIAASKPHGILVAPKTKIPSSSFPTPLKYFFYFKNNILILRNYFSKNNILILKIIFQKIIYCY